MGRYLSRVSKEVLQNLPYADSSKQLILIELFILYKNKRHQIDAFYFR